MIAPKLTGKVVGGKETVKKLQAFESGLRDELRTTIKKLAFDLELLIKSQKLSGQVLNYGKSDPAHIHLRDSINTRIEETATSIVASVGTSLDQVPYARIHEYGGVITAKNAPWLTFQTADGAWHRVKEVTIPERSYLRSALGERRDTIEQRIRKTAQTAARAAGLKT